MKPSTADIKELVGELHTRIRGEVRFDDGSRALYATDASNYRQVPIGVVIPKDSVDVIQTVSACRSYGVPILVRGGGTSLAGQCCNVAVIIDMSKYMNRVIEIDPTKKVACVQPGLVLDDLHAIAERYHLTFGPDPATHSHCTLGGMIGNNSCGVHSVMAGKTVDNIEELKILTYDGTSMSVGKTSNEELERIIKVGDRRGEIYSKLRSLRDKYGDLIRERYPNIPRRVSGYNLDQLLPENGFHIARALVGTESTCVTVLEATVRLVYSPPARTLLVLGYPDIYIAGDHIMEILAHNPIALEGLDDRLIEDVKKKGLYPEKVELLPVGGGWLLVEFGGETKQEADDHARGLMKALKNTSHPPNVRLFDNPEETSIVWKVRESGLGATAFVPGRPLTWEGWEDSAVPPEKLGNYLRDLRKLFDKYGYDGDFYGHFGQGCVHTRINFDLETPDGIKKFRSFLGAAADLVVRYGGSLSGEHGDGQSRAELLPKMFGNELVQAFREFKMIWDPDWMMNPGKVVNPYRVDENLRLGPSFRPSKLKTHFAFPDDDGSFSRATLRCVGVGKCRRLEGGTMCPSFMVTREEEHSSRGRARLLFEMLQGDLIKHGWRDEHVKEALSLCLACKGCKGDCPVNVDIATYKAEFLSHYYAGRIRPITAYTMGLIHCWIRLVAFIPGVSNFFIQTPLLRDVVKAMIGIAPERQIPIFASRTFKQWFFQRDHHNEGKPKVLLWPDTFNNYFHPEVAQAAVEVLEAIGYQVVVPRQILCCGRPLYDFGMLDMAKRLLRNILETLHPFIVEGIPLIGLEPSCVAVFRDEILNLFPNDADAKQLSHQSFLLSEFLEKKVNHYEFPQLQRKSIVQGHCHHNAIMKMKDEQAVLSKLNLDFEILDSGCCGMAGSFGFEKEHYDISIKVGERALLPAVRNAAKDTIIIANGFSCREQIAQTTDRHALHIAQVIQMAIHQDSLELGDDHPEVVSASLANALNHSNQSGVQRRLGPTKTIIVGLCTLSVGFVAWWMRKRRLR